MLDEKCMNNLIFVGTFLSIISRIAFGIVLWKNKSRNPISLSICLINIASNSFWLPYSIQTSTRPLFVRSIADMTISFIGFIYISYNRFHDFRQKLPMVV